MRLFWLLLPLLAACTTYVGGSDDDDATGDDDDAVLDTITSEERPTKRSEFLAVADEPSNSIVVFGGNMGPVVNQIPYAEYTGETWLFEPGFGWTELDPTDAPSERGRFGAGYDPSGRMLLFGGRWRLPETSGNYTLYNDLWAFEFETQSWTDVSDGSGPSGRYHPGVVWSTEQDRLFLWGGATNTNALVLQPSDDFWTWSDADGWQERSTSGTGPTTRVFFGTTYDSTRDRLLVYAGQIGDFQSQAYNDLYALDLGTSTWTKLHDGTGTAPSTRMHPHLIYDAALDRYLMWGGHTDIGDGNDLWAFDPASDTWELIYEGDTFTGNGLGCGGNPSEVPADYVDQDLSAPERRHRAMIAELEGNLWIFGGMHAECSDHLDDTWRYDLEANTWHELIEARSGESCLRRADDCKCLCL